MGRWSEFRACTVSQVVRLASELSIVVMSGDVGCWFGFGGLRVGVLVLRMECVEFCMVSAMWLPLWSFVGECQSVECAFISPVIMLFWSVVSVVSMSVMSLSSVVWPGFVVSLGGM